MFEQIDSREFVHRVDRDDRLCLVNPPWFAFAAENDWSIGEADVIGAPLMASISDPQTRHLYGLLLRRVRARGEPIRFEYRCDSPDRRRLLEMQMHFDANLDQVEFRSRVLRIERRQPVALFDVRQRERSNDLLSVCSWCKAVCAGTSWVEVEQAVRRLHLFAVEALPRISHGICPSCSERLSTVAEG